MHPLHEALACAMDALFSMKHQPACTMRDVAGHLGVSHATVSRALRNDPRITEAVRLRVVKAARSLGYKRDPAMAQLMSRVRASKARAYQGTLAWVTDGDLTAPHDASTHALHWPFAFQRAAELGYKLECFSGCRAGDSARLGRRLRAQGIQGLVIQQFKEGFHLPDWKFNWKHFAVVHNGSSQSFPCLDSVDADDIGNCVEVFEQLAGLGYRRVGICTTRAIEAATNYALSTARARFAMLHPGLPEIPSCLLPDLGAKSTRVVAQWLRKHRVDAVASQVRGMRELLENAGWRVPEDLGLAYQGVHPQGRNCGVWQREDLIATVMIETLIASVEQGRLGLPAVPRSTVIPGTWHPGTTCRPQKVATRRQS